MEKNGSRLLDKKGQALIEFVLILPVFLLILFAIIDFGIIFHSKSKIENDSTDIIQLFQNGHSIEEIQALYSDNTIDITNRDNQYYIFTIRESIHLITPGFNRIFGDPYQIQVERIVPYA